MTDQQTVRAPDWSEMLDSEIDQRRAQANWDQIENELRGQQKLADANGHAIKRLALARLLYDLAMVDVMKRGAITEAPKTKVQMQNPYLAVANKQADICAQIEAELTLSPRKRNTGGKVALPPSKRGGGAVEL